MPHAHTIRTLEDQIAARDARIQELEHRLGQLAILAFEIDEHGTRAEQLAGKLRRVVA